jgi:hypothetical protein
MIALDGIERDNWPEALKPFAQAAHQQIEISFAAAQLAKLRRDAKTRRRQRAYTGVIDGKRGWRRMKVILADGHIGELVMARRGAALVTWRDEFAVKPDKIGACGTDELRRYRLPAAVLLGGCKRGVKERSSTRKAKAARINGCVPPRPGSRPRGRPRATATPVKMERAAPGDCP